MDRPNPQNAAPAIQPTSVLLRPNSRSKSLMMSPRMANVIAVATSATQLAVKSRRWFMAAPIRRAARYHYRPFDENLHNFAHHDPAPERASPRSSAQSSQAARCHRQHKSP